MRGHYRKWSEYPMLLLHLHPSIDSCTDCLTEIKPVIKIVLEDLFDGNKNKIEEDIIMVSRKQKKLYA